ncbi:MAG: ABC transporter permease [Acidimicrobiia bacterium]|nr:ABC transporter permease [Acidimicrobiia bacterium]
MTAGTPRRRSAAWTIARTDLRQLLESRDFWLPLAVVALLFFVVLPALLLYAVSSVEDAELVGNLGNVIGALPESVRRNVRGDTPEVEASYALAVYLFAPLAVIVPLTVSSAIGAHTIVGERERGSGEFLAHSPASERDIYVGKLVAGLVPGYLTAAVGFGLYSVVVNVIVGPGLGGWFFPTSNWWVLMGWVVPPFIALALALILAVSAKVSSAAAAQQASALVSLPLILVAYGVASGTLFQAQAAAVAIGGVAWLGAAIALWRGARVVTRERLLGLGG